jgi:TM2 domain-containing membrane protein YozV
MPTALFCTKCGQSNDSDAVFCSKCGARQTPAEQPVHVLVPSSDVGSGSPPYDVLVQRDMTPQQRAAFQSKYATERKSPETALILAIFGLHYFYVGKIGLGILMWISLFLVVGIVWWFIDLFRVKGIVHEFNDLKAQEVAQQVRLL